MPFSSGVFNRLYNWVNDANNNIDILPARVDAEDNGFATGLSTCLLKDGTQTVTANIPFAGFRLTGVGAATSLTDASQVSQVQNNAYNLCTVSGTANAIVLTTTPTTSALTTGRRLAFKATSNSTSNVTINENSLGALNLYLSGGVTQAFSGIIQSGNWYIVTFDQALNSAAGGYVMDSLGLGGMAYLNIGTVLVNDGSGNLTIGAGQVTAAMLAAGLLSNNVGFPNDFRISLTSGVPLTTSDVTGATTIYMAPYIGNRIALYDGSANWNILTTAQISLALGTLADGTKPYDIFCYNNSGTPTLEFLVWTSTTARATALVYQNGVLVKSGATTRRYLGTFMPTATTTTEDSYANRYLWNYYNRCARPMRAFDSTASWTYTTSTWRQTRGNSANQLNFILGVEEDSILAIATGNYQNSTANVNGYVGIGLNATNAPATGSSYGVMSAASNVENSQTAQFTGLCPIGVNFIASLEQSGASGTGTFTGGGNATGISGTVNG